MTAAPALHTAVPPTTVGEALDRLAFVREGLRAVRKAVADPQVKSALDTLTYEVNAIRVALPELVTDHGRSKTKKAIRRSPSAKARAHPVWQSKNRRNEATGVDERFCPRHHAGTGAWVPADYFDVKDPVRGTLRYCCRDCWREYQRERYVAANRRAIIIEVQDGDEIVGAYCNGCGHPFAVGDLVAGTSLKHRDCIPTPEAANQ